VFSGIWFTKIVKDGLAGQRDLLSHFPKSLFFAQKRKEWHIFCWPVASVSLLAPERVGYDP
jgi:hypothetical protein